MGTKDDCLRVKQSLCKDWTDEVDNHQNYNEENQYDSDKSTWNSLFSCGALELLDCEEEETCMIATFPSDLKNKKHYSKWTHCEIHPSLILGVCATVIPFPDHNQSPRNVYQSAMGKQAIGLYATNHQYRMDTNAHVLYYPQVPLVANRNIKYFYFNKMPAGINCIVAIMSYTGYNQEDSLIMNQSSIDRGLFRSFYFRSYTTEERFLGSQAITKILKPLPETTIGLRRGDYSKLDADGIVQPGSRVLGDDVLVGKVSPLPPDDQNAIKYQKTQSDQSIVVRSSESGVVDSVVLTLNSRYNKFVKVKLRTVRVPQIGDKFASRHGQKGTIGITYRLEDMPFNRDGISPDLIMNPHAVPSRMTIGHLCECLMGKISCLTGRLSDATPFNEGFSIHDFANLLKSKKGQPYGNEKLFSGFTGKPLREVVFFGPTYYQRLKHMVDDKIHSRARGPITMLTRQPMEGRCREGGLRFGEMERDCMISHGGAAMLKERLFDQSDAYRLHICSECSGIAEANPTQEQYRCRNCNSSGKSGDVSQFFLPYACKLLIQELAAMHIDLKLRIVEYCHDVDDEDK